jgi:hypothetical protein
MNVFSAMLHLLKTEEQIFPETLSAQAHCRDLINHAQYDLQPVVDTLFHSNDK